MQHLTIENEAGGKTTVCIDRRTQTARLLEWQPEQLEAICTVLKAMGVTDVEAYVVATRPESLSILKAVGFTEIRAYSIRRLND